MTGKFRIIRSFVINLFTRLEKVIQTHSPIGDMIFSSSITLACIRGRRDGGWLSILSLTILVSFISIFTHKLVMDFDNGIPVVPRKKEAFSNGV